MAEISIAGAETILWDLDGTIIDSLGVLESGLAEILPSHGHKVPDHETMVANFHGSLEHTVMNILGIDEPVAQIIVQDFLKVQDTYYEAVDRHLLSDAVNLAERAHAAGKRQILVTNRAHTGRLKASPRSIVANSVLTNYIDTVIAGDDSEHRKPKPEVLGTLLASIVPEKTVVVGDQFVDAEFAHNIGATAILVDRDGQGIAHLDTLGKDVHYDIVRDLHEVMVQEL